MKVKVIECNSFEEFLDAMQSIVDEVVEKVDDADSFNPTEATDEVKDSSDSSTETSGNEVKIPSSLSFYVKLFRKKHGMTYRQMVGFFDGLWHVSKTSVYNILAKQVAITIDKYKYKDHISNSNKLFVINLYDGNVYECKAAIKNLELIPVFRTEEDAELAKSILKPMLDEMFE